MDPDVEVLLGELGDREDAAVRWASRSMALSARVPSGPTASRSSWRRSSSADIVRAHRRLELALPPEHRLLTHDIEPYRRPRSDSRRPVPLVRFVIP